MPRILFVSGFHPDTRARDLAIEFERFGRLVRCDIPILRGHQTNSPYAFVEFKDEKDAENSYHHVHGHEFEGHRLSVQWAKNPPSKVWRVDKRSGTPPTSSRTSGDHSPPSRRRSLSPPPRRERIDDRDNDRYLDKRRRSRSPARDYRSRDYNGSRGYKDEKGGRLLRRESDREGYHRSPVRDHDRVRDPYSDSRPRDRDRRHGSPRARARTPEDRYIGNSRRGDPLPRNDRAVTPPRR